MDLQQKLKNLNKQIEQYEKQANANINQMIGQRELLKQRPRWWSFRY